MNRSGIPGRRARARRRIAASGLALLLALATGSGVGCEGAMGGSPGGKGPGTALDQTLPITDPALVPAISDE